MITTLGNLFKHMCLCHQAAEFGVDACGWEGNRRSDVALAMGYRL